MRLTRLLAMALVGAASFAVMSCRGGRLIAVGLDGDGRAMAATFNERMYERRLEQAMREATGAVHEATHGLAASSDDDEFQLQLIVIGANLKTELGFGPFKLGIVPGLRAYFTNVDNPPPLP